MYGLHIGGMVHVGFIPDGNRRWAKHKSVSPGVLRQHWMRQLCVILRDWSGSSRKCAQLSTVNQVSLYICSIDNVRRTDHTMGIIYPFLDEALEATLSCYNCLTAGSLHVNIVGSVHLLRKQTQDVLARVREKYTSDKPVFTLNLAVAYDYEKDMANHGVWKDPEYDTRRMSQIDVVVRTGGDKRTSGFFPTKTYYSELFFLKKFWPDLGVSDVVQVLRRFRNRQRRFGA